MGTQPNDQCLSADVLICYKCSMIPKALSPLPVPTRDICVVCGSTVGFFNKEDMLKARVCLRHKDHVAPWTAKCFVCKMIIHLPTAPPYAMTADPYAVRADPYAMRADPYAMRADPYAMRADPYAMRADPYAMRADPYAMRADPYAMRVDPYAMTATPGYVCQICWRCDNQCVALCT